MYLSLCSFDHPQPKTKGDKKQIHFAQDISNLGYKIKQNMIIDIHHLQRMPYKFFNTLVYTFEKIQIKQCKELAGHTITNVMILQFSFQFQGFKKFTCYLVYRRLKV